MAVDVKSVALVMHAPWLSNSDFDTICKGNLNENDEIRYRCTEYPIGYDQSQVDYLLKNYRTAIPGLNVGISIAYAEKIGSKCCTDKVARV